MTLFLRIGDAAVEDKGEVLRSGIRDAQGPSGKVRFDVDTANFSNIPGSPFAYWVTDRIRQLFTNLPSFEAEERTAKVGLGTSDDFRFVRSWWEATIVRTPDSWVPLAKGGSFSPYYKDISDLLNWRDDAHELKAFVEATPGTSHWSRRLSGWEYYFRPGLTWPLRAAPKRC